MRRISHKLTLLCAGIAIFCVSGCVAVSLGIYEHSKRIRADERLSGDFVDLYYQEVYKFVQGLEFVEFFHANEEHKRYELHTFQLDGFKGFGIRLSSLGDDVYSELEFEAGDKLHSFERSSIRPWYFGAYEQFGDVFVFYFPKTEGIEQITKKHEVRFISTTPDEDVINTLDDESDRMMIVDSSERLEFIMAQLLESKQVIPMPMIPVAVSEQWSDPPNRRGDVSKFYRDQLRDDYPELVKRLEEFDGQNED